MRAARRAAGWFLVLLMLVGCLSDGSGRLGMGLGNSGGNDKAIVREFVSNASLRARLARASADRGPASGYLLLTHLPFDAEQARYRLILEQFQRSLPDSSEVDPHAVTKYVTYVVMKGPVRKTEISLPEFMEKYDLGFSQRLLTRLNSYNTALAVDKPGPFLVAFEGAALGNLDNTRVLYLDLSAYSDADLPAAFAAWRKFVTMDISDWEATYIRVRDEYINVLNRYSSFFLEKLGSQ